MGFGTVTVLDLRNQEIVHSILTDKTVRTNIDGWCGFVPIFEVRFRFLLSTLDG